MRQCIAAVVLFLLAVPASAADAENSKPGSSVTAIETGILRGIYVGTFAVHAYEAHTTLDVLAHGGKEIDPLMRPFASHPTASVMVNLARAAAIDLAVHSIARRHKIAAIAVGLAINSGYIAIAEHNRRVANAMRQGR